jgi:hypothetical protein
MWEKLLLTASHSKRSSPGGSRTASLKFPLPRVASMCFRSWAPCFQPAEQNMMTSKGSLLVDVFPLKQKLSTSRSLKFCLQPKTSFMSPQKNTYAHTHAKKCRRLRDSRHTLLPEGVLFLGRNVRWFLSHDTRYAHTVQKTCIQCPINLVGQTTEITEMQNLLHTNNKGFFIFSSYSKIGPIWVHFTSDDMACVYDVILNCCDGCRKNCQVGSSAVTNVCLLLFTTFKPLGWFLAFQNQIPCKQVHLQCKIIRSLWRARLLI